MKINNKIYSCDVLNTQNLYSNTELENVFAYTFNDDNEYIKINSNIKNIKFDRKFNNTINKLPNTILDIGICGVFNKKINCLPKSLINLSIASNFDFTVNNIGSNITKLCFGYRFNKKLYNLPNSIKKLKLGFNEFYYKTNSIRKLNNLSNSLEKLELICEHFNDDISQLPRKLLYLHINSNNFNQLVDNLPMHLKYLKINSPVFNKFLDLLPNYLEELHVSYCVSPLNDLPLSLKKLIIDFSFIHSKDKNKINYKHEFKNLPQSLIYLKVSSSFESKINHLPKKILSLDLNSLFNNEIDNLPSNLLQLKFGLAFNQNIDNLPNTIKHLFLSTNYNIHINKLPASLINIVFFMVSYDNIIKKNKTNEPYIYIEDNGHIFNIQPGKYVDKEYNNNFKLYLDNITCVKKDNIVILNNTDDNVSKNGLKFTTYFSEKHEFNVYEEYDKF